MCVWCLCLKGVCVSAWVWCEWCVSDVDMVCVGVVHVVCVRVWVWCMWYTCGGGVGGVGGVRVVWRGCM